MKKLLTVGLFILSLNIYGAMPAKVIVVGTIESITDKTVTLKTMTGSVKVPKNSLRKKANLTIGETARAEVTPQGLKQLNG